MKKLILLLSLTLLTTSAFANFALAEEPRSWPEQGQMVFRGLDTKSSPTQIAEGRAQDLLNVQFTTTSALKKRNGYSLVNLSLDDATLDFDAITGIYYTKLSSGTEFILATVGKRLKYNASGVWTQVSSPTITAGNNYQFVFITALDNIIMSNDTNPAFKWTGTGSSSLLDLSDLSTDAPTAFKTMAWFQNFLVIANTVENAVEKPTRIRWSNIGTVETFTEADRNDIAELGGQEINGLIELYNDLYILLTDSVWKMSHVGGDEQFKFTKVLDNIGCIAKNTPKNIILKNSQRGIIFLTKDKRIYFFDGVTATNISDIIEPTMDLLNASRLQYAVAEDTGTEYRLYVTTGSSATTNNQVIVFNYEVGEFSLFSQIDANAVARVVESDIVVSYAGDYNSNIFKLDNTANDSDIDGVTGTVSAVSVRSSQTASGLQIIYDSTASYTASGLMGGIITITGGTGSSDATLERVIADNTTTGIMVTEAFTTTPDTTTTFSVGAIDAYYQTKDYDLGDSSIIKSLAELFMWTEEQGTVSIDVSYKVDFKGTVETQSISEDGGGGTWGTAIWGTSVWGGLDALLNRVKLKGEARYMNIKFREDDIDETFNIYGYRILYWLRKHF